MDDQTKNNNSINEGSVAELYSQSIASEENSISEIKPTLNSGIETLAVDESDRTKGMESLDAVGGSTQVGDGVSKEPNNFFSKSESVESNKFNSISDPSVDDQKAGKLVWIFIGFVLIGAIILGAFSVFKNRSMETPLSSFEECISSKGSVVQETYPPVCISKEGLRFIAEVPPVEEPVEEPIQPADEKEKAEECYKQATDTECAEGTVCMANPASVFCECMGGEIKMRETGDGGQYGACLIEGTEYDEWEYFRKMAPKEGDETGDKIESPFENIGNADYILEKSEGTCSTDSQCIWASQGCGGGHGICTNEPEKYEGIATTCEVNPNFPANLGYSCVCIETQGKCGWEK